jgi:hypothetical protein
MMRPLLMIGAVALAAAVPPAPRGPFECSSEWDQASATASATLSWPQVPGSIHLYDLEVGTSEDGARQFPFASVTSATPTATVGGLRPDTTYYFKVRAHCDGTGDDCPLGGLGQMIGGWSNFSSVVPCKTGQSITASPPSEPPTKATAALVETEWLEVYRVTENQQTWPDFLANHDTGDIKGDSAFLTFAGGGTHGKTHFFNFDTSPRVRYCVEVQKVSLQIKQRTPSAPPFIPVDPRFAVRARWSWLPARPIWTRFSHAFASRITSPATETATHPQDRCPREPPAPTSAGRTTAASATTTSTG